MVEHLVLRSCITQPFERAIKPTCPTIVAIITMREDELHFPSDRLSFGDFLSSHYFATTNFRGTSFLNLIVRFILLIKLRLSFFVPAKKALQISFQCSKREDIIFFTPILGRGCLLLLPCFYKSKAYFCTFKPQDPSPHLQSVGHILWSSNRFISSSTHKAEIASCCINQVQSDIFEGPFHLSHLVGAFHKYINVSWTFPLAVSCIDAEVLPQPSPKTHRHHQVYDLLPSELATGHRWKRGC